MRGDALVGGGQPVHEAAAEDERARGERQQVREHLGHVVRQRLRDVVRLTAMA